MLTPSLRVINSRTPNLCFHRPCFFLWFSIVFYNNYGGDSKTLFYKFGFLVRYPVAISVVTDGDSTGDFRELGHLIKYINWCGFFKYVVFFFIYLFFSLFFFILFVHLIFICFILFYFSLFIIIIIIIVYIFVNFGWFLFFFIYLLFMLLYSYAWILNSRIDDFIIYICLFFFSLFVCRKKGFGYALSSLHTHTMYMTCVGPYTRAWVTLELEGIV